MVRYTGYIILAFLITQSTGYRPKGNSYVPNGHYPSDLQQTNKLREVFGWKQLDFHYPNANMRQKAISDGDFVASNVVPIGVAAAGTRVFISMPRWYNGVPTTLATVPFPSDTSSPLLKPYPNWEWSRQGNCEGLTSVFRVKIDECNRLWVLDTGVVNSFVDAQAICPPQIVVFDLKNDKMIYRYRFPQNAVKSDSLLVSMEVEYPRGQCGAVTSAMLYVADVTTFALIVVDLPNGGRAWRVQDKTMYPQPEAGTYALQGESFELMDGILGLALSPRSDQSERKLYYHAMSGFYQRWVRLSLLRNATAASSNPREFQTAPYKRRSQAAGCSMDQNGVMFFGLVVENTLACWNTRKPFSAANMVPLMKDDRILQFLTTTTVDPDSRLWTISNRLQSFISGTINPRETNYRILMHPSTTEIVQGTACERGGHGHGHGHQGHPTGIDPANQLVFRP